LFTRFVAHGLRFLDHPMPGPPFAQRPLDDRGLPEGYPLQDGWEVTPREVKALIDAGRVGAGGDVLLLDVRTPAELAAAAIDGATALPMQEIRMALPDLEAYADGPVIVSCHHGGRSLQVTAFLRQQGVEDVKSMAGGIDVWARDIDPALPRY